MLTVTITTAIKLSTKQLDAIKKAVTVKYGTEVEYVQVIDPSVIGGVNLTIGSTQIDATVKHKLDQLKTQLLHQV